MSRRKTWVRGGRGGIGGCVFAVWELIDLKSSPNNVGGRASVSRGLLVCELEVLESLLFGTLRVSFSGMFLDADGAHACFPSPLLPYAFGPFGVYPGLIITVYTSRKYAAAIMIRKIRYPTMSPIAVAVLGSTGGSSTMVGTAGS